jgi:two-component system cell cycle sensor histidine kinase/response regulator CckA
MGIQLPLAATAASQARDHVRRTGRSRAPGILVADDEPLVRELLGIVLQARGFVVWQAASGAEALELYERQGAGMDLVLLDVAMPDLTGQQIIQELQARNPAVRCCLTTGDRSCQSSAELLLELGVIWVFHKPFSLMQVVEILWQLACVGLPS